MSSYLNSHQEWRDAQAACYAEHVTARDVSDREDTDPADLPELYLDTDDPWCSWMIAELIIAWQDEMQSLRAPW